MPALPHIYTFACETRPGIKLATDYFADIRARNVIRRRLVITEQVPGRLERLINKAELSALHLRGISRPNASPLPFPCPFLLTLQGIRYLDGRSSFNKVLQLPDPGIR